MQTEDIRSDEALRELVVRAFDNITSLSDQIDEQYLTALFRIFQVVHPVLDEAKKNPPPNASQKMRDLLQNIVDEDETSTAPAQESDDNELEDNNEEERRDIENEDEENDDNDDDDDHGDEDKMALER